MTKAQKHIIQSIAELIEDKQYPARRNIADYVTLLLDHETRGEADLMFANYFDDVDKNKSLTPLTNTEGEGE